MMKKRRSEREIELTAIVWEENEGFVSLCPELGVTSCGDSVEDAARMLQEAAALYLANARELGMVDQSLGSLIQGQRWTTSIKVAV